ncbi:hypothetical protein J6590_029083 [Homalodisca vitripennis]|nr:hypothetical protein J6590_094727 [Homalodisca vitripennis]KAG8263605.1 hypothetical protein J6590_029083 [Homalodisca vitripennis]
MGKTYWDVDAEFEDRLSLQMNCFYLAEQLTYQQQSVLLEGDQCNVMRYQQRTGPCESDDTMSLSPCCLPGLSNLNAGMSFIRRQATFAESIISRTRRRVAPCRQPNQNKPRRGIWTIIHLEMDNVNLSGLHLGPGSWETWELISINSELE